MEEQKLKGGAAGGVHKEKFGGVLEEQKEPWRSLGGPGAGRRSTEKEQEEQEDHTGGDPLDSLRQTAQSASCSALLQVRDNIVPLQDAHHLIIAQLGDSNAQLFNC